MLGRDPGLRVWREWEGERTGLAMLSGICRRSGALRDDPASNPGVLHRSVEVAVIAFVVAAEFGDASVLNTGTSVAEVFGWAGNAFDASPLHRRICHVVGLLESAVHPHQRLTPVISSRWAGTSDSISHPIFGADPSSGCKDPPRVGFRGFDYFSTKQRFR